MTAQAALSAHPEDAVSLGMQHTRSIDAVEQELVQAAQQSMQIGFSPQRPSQDDDTDFAHFTDTAETVEIPREFPDGTLHLQKDAVIDQENLESTAPSDLKVVVASSPRQKSPFLKAQSTPTGAMETLTLEKKDGSTNATSSADDEAERTGRFVTPKDFELLRVIGMGAFGKVLQVRNRQSSQVLAMKVISKRLLKRKSGYVENVLAERDILTKVNSPFVVTMHCSFQTREKLFIIMDFLAGGELFLRIGREGIFLEETAAFYLGEIVLALDHLHTLGILHRDLKPENILLGSDGHICLTDFGLAKQLSVEEGGDDERALTICGTQDYMSPEMLARKGYSRPSDYWSLGCIAYEMLKGNPPFERKRGESNKDQFRRIMTEKVKMPSGSSAAACKLLKGLLNRNVTARWGAAKSSMFEVGGVAGLKKAGFFSSIDWNKLVAKDLTPPYIMAVQNEQDAQHFHEEFTKMRLPRSVLEMSHEQFQAKRVESDMFRGFSFIQEDFHLPNREEEEIDAYWKSIEDDAESVSECASSKVDNDDQRLLADIVVPEKKKRPPRKRKKKGASGATPNASAANTPATSRAPSPVSMYVNDNASSIGALDVPENDVPAMTNPLESDADAEVAPTKSEAASQTAEASAPPTAQTTPAEKVKPKGQTPIVVSLKPSSDAWQTASTKKKLTTPLRGDTQRHPPGSKAKPNAVGASGAASAPRSKPSGSSPWVEKTSVKDRHANIPNGNQQVSNGHRLNRVDSAYATAQIPPSPSSDWRNHGMSPRTEAHLNPMVQSSSVLWPSLKDPPLPSKGKATPPKPQLHGAWAKR